MAKARLLQAVCAVALLAAAPAFAQQTTTQPATTGAGNSVNAPVTHDQTAAGSAVPSSMAPAEKMGHTGGHSMHHGGMSGHPGMHARADNSQNTTDQLNDQSYQAAQSGQAFSGSSGMMSPGASGSMNTMPSNSPVPAASGAGGGGASGGGGAK